MYYIVDRIEGDYAVCENSETFDMENIPLSDLPEGIEEGNCIRHVNDEYIRDLEIEEQRRNDLNEKVKRAWGNIDN